MFKRLRPTIPLDKDSTGRFLPFIIAVMTLLCILLLMGAFSLSHALEGWKTGLDGRVSVQVLSDVAEQGAPSLEQRTAEALAILRASPDVVSATPIEAEAMGRLLAPWVDNAADLTDLPVPVLIDVVLRAPSSNVQGLKSSLEAIAGVRLDDHGTWLADVRHLVRVVIGAAYTLNALIALSCCLVIYLLVKAGVAMHRDVIELLHLVGADDEFIIQQFQWHVLFVAMKGASVGAILALGVWLTLAGSVPLVSRYLLTGHVVFIAIFLILLLMALSVLTSRATVGRLLKEFL